MNIWPSVEHFVDSWPEASLGPHGIHLIAAAHWQESGVKVPAAYQNATRIRAIKTPVTGMLLERVREMVSGPIILMKGPEIATRYPNPALRPFSDLDLLVSDADLAQRQLVDAGFTRTADEARFRNAHHRAPLLLRPLPLALEIHDDPGWFPWINAPSPSVLFANAVPSALCIDGIMTLSPEHHALFIAAHAWRHGPLGSLLHLIDLAVITEGQDRPMLDQLALSWGMGPIWESSQSAIDAIFDARELRQGLTRRWVTQLRDGHVRSLAEHYAAQLLAPLWAPTLSGRIKGEVAALRTTLAPRPDQTFVEKIQRGRHALANLWRSMPEFLSDD